MKNGKVNINLSIGISIQRIKNPPKFKTRKFDAPIRSILRQKQILHRAITSLRNNPIQINPKPTQK